MKNPDLKVECRGIENIDPSYHEMTVHLSDIQNSSDILSQLVKSMTLSSVIAEIGVEDILDEIGPKQVKEHFNLVEAMEEAS